MLALIEFHMEDEIDITAVDKHRVLVTITKQGGDPNNKIQLLMGINTLVALEEVMGNFIDDEITVIKEIKPSGTDMSIRSFFNKERDKEC